MSEWERKVAMELVLTNIAEERAKQVQKWGTQHRPSLDAHMPTGYAKQQADLMRELCDKQEKAGPQPGFTGGTTWQNILLEEAWEAFAEDNDKAALRKELVQSAAVIVAWIEDLDAH